MDNVRFILVVALAMLGLMLWEAWQEDYARPPQSSQSAEAPSAQIDTPQPRAADPVATSQLPDMPRAAHDIKPDETAVDKGAVAYIEIETDLMSLAISTAGGTLERSALKAYPIDPDLPDVPVELFGRNPPRVYLYQSGLAGDAALPNHHQVYSAEATAYRMVDGQDTLVVPLKWISDDGVEVEKRYIFTRGDYRIIVEYEVRNNRSEPIVVHRYDQLKRNEESSRQGMVYTFTGPVLSTPEQRFEKYDYDDLEDQAIDVTARDAWAGIIQHYFASALIPPAAEDNHFYSKALRDEQYLIGFLAPPREIVPGASTTLTSTLFIGPKRHDILNQLGEGLELTVDYGMLWFIAKPLFQALEFIHDMTGNWGWGIIILTLMLKLVFYPLSAAGYRSMANMRRVQPRMLALRDRYKDDRTQLNQAMMSLYKEEKINPLGGCLPILVQIPVFIALYWVLLETVEMRQAPFVLWITDLSSKDPLFVLPLLMGVSMWIQQKLNPAPLDPTQAKVMQILPFVFTVFFAFFPSGLVLCWLVNNILSIIQQWHITRTIENAAA